MPPIRLPSLQTLQYGCGTFNRQAATPQCVPCISQQFSQQFAHHKPMPARLQIKAEDCSPLGQAILHYLEEQGISMNHLAELSGVPQPRLRGACFKGTCPTPETLRKLAKVMGKHHLELYTLAYEGRIEALPQDGDDGSLDRLMRELFETARELGFIAPNVRPSKAKIRKALLELGFHAAKTDAESRFGG